MVFATMLMRGLPAALLLGSGLANAADEPKAAQDNTANITSGAPPPVDHRTTLNLCEARTINYITHALPQSCLTSSWKSPVHTSSPPTASASPRAGNNGQAHQGAGEVVATKVTGHNTTEVQVTEPAVTTFMSFEDWKEMMLRRAGQDPQDLRSRKPTDHGNDDRYSAESGHAGLGEEGEISLNFENYPNGDGQGSASPGSNGPDSGDQPPATDAALHEEGKAATVHLSKDAGKTCKERFSYSSFDAGATILKTSPGAKNARAILVENKDSYMLLECDSPSKYVIVELSDDISVDTVVLANFEFFSSMVRHFRISVSDRYPVKMDKWRELGTFEARNSRDIQPFLVENPQIWAKYVRIEFLTHFGNEYYCPISLLRVHGSRMLDSWKDSEGGRDEEALIDADESRGIDAHHGEDHMSDTASSTNTHPNWTTSGEPSSKNWHDTLYLVAKLNDTCPAPPFQAGSSQSGDSKPSPIGGEVATDDVTVSGEAPHARSASERSGSALRGYAETILAAASTYNPSTITTPGENPVDSNSSSGNGNGNGNIGSSNITASNVGTTITDRQHNATTATAKMPASSGQNGKVRSSMTTGASAASPTMQEGFFNAITKRLQHVESNLTLSMKYVEDQSKHVQEALQLREQKQQARINFFLDELNKTVLAELHTVREQYDQIWQSTVLALESQRDRSERDMMALSSRLNLLADEVVFQKRMAIVQAIILLSCLFLIIFSRGVSLPSLAPLLDQTFNSPCATPSSPTTPRQDSYQDSHRRRKELQQSVSPPSLTREVQNIYLDTASNDDTAISIPSEALSLHDLDEANDACSAFQNFSPPPTPNTPDGTCQLDKTDSATEPNRNLPRRVGGTSHINSRKPLPSLPEHPRPSDGD